MGRACGAPLVWLAALPSASPSAHVPHGLRSPVRVSAGAAPQTNEPGGGAGVFPALYAKPRMQQQCPTTLPPLQPRPQALERRQHWAGVGGGVPVSGPITARAGASSAFICLLENKRMRKRRFYSRSRHPGSPWEQHWIYLEKIRWCAPAGEE